MYSNNLVDAANIFYLSNLEIWYNYHSRCYFNKDFQTTNLSNFKRCKSQDEETHTK